MALSNIDKTKIVVADAKTWGAFGYKDLDSLRKGINLVTIIQNGYKLGKITDSSATGYVKVQLLNEIYGANAEDTYTVLYFKRSELSYDTSYTKTVKTSTTANHAAVDLQNYWVKISSGVLNIREKPSTTAKILRKLTNNQLVGKSDGIGIMSGSTEFYRFVNSAGAVYYVGSQYLTNAKPSPTTKVTTTDKNDNKIVISPTTEPDIKAKETPDSPDNQSELNMQFAYYALAIIVLVLILYYFFKPKKNKQNASDGTK